MAEKTPLVIDKLATCACGQARLHAKGRVLSMFYCACLECQKASGTGHAGVVLMHRTSVEISGPVSQYERDTASRSRFTRRFCSGCGAPLCGHSARAPDLVMLPIGLFAPDTEWFAPNQLIFARSHPAWDLIDDHLPRYETYREGTG